MKLKYIDFTIVHNKESVVPAKNYEDKYKEPPTERLAT